MCLHFTVQSVCLPFCVRTESPLNSVGHWDFHPYKTPFCCPSLSNVLSCICHFYHRSWWGGSDWGRRDLDCRWYLSHLRPLVQWILLKQQLVFLHHILRCLWEKEVCSVSQATCWLAHTFCWWSNWGGFWALQGPGWNFLTGAQVGWEVYLPTKTISSSISGLMLSH